MMGSNADDEPDSKPVHQVTLTKAFYIGTYEVTQSQYEQVMNHNPSIFTGANNPVEQVRWQDAVEFCRRLSDLPAEKAAGRVYRLPTEAEWEYACRAGTTTAFAFGNELKFEAPLREQVACADNADEIVPQQTRPVGSFPANSWGLFDMHGNVWEWTQDFYQEDYYTESPTDDPKGPSKGSHHVLRGGSASVASHECTSSIRGEAMSDGPNSDAAERYEHIGDFGFRLVLNPPDTGGRPH